MAIEILTKAGAMLNARSYAQEGSDPAGAARLDKKSGELTGLSRSLDFRDRKVQESSTPGGLS